MRILGAALVILVQLVLAGFLYRVFAVGLSLGWEPDTWRFVLALSPLLVPLVWRLGGTRAAAFSLATTLCHLNFFYLVFIVVVHWRLP